MPKQTIFVVTPELQAVLDSLPADQPRSRLEPFRPFILRWRRQGRSYRRIQQILANECHTKVSYETLRRFVRRRNRARVLEVETATEASTGIQNPVKADRYADARERIRQLKTEPLPKPQEKLFSYTEEDSIKPLVLKKKEQ